MTPIQHPTFFQDVSIPMEVDPPVKIQDSTEPGSSFLKIYRSVSVSPRGPVTEQEYQVLEKIFSRLAHESWWGLMKHKGKIDDLKSQVIHIHPFNFIETVCCNEELKKLFLIAINNYFIRKPCMKGFKDELREQHFVFQNIEPHLETFAMKMGLDGIMLSQYLLANKIDAMLHHILERNS